MGAASGPFAVEYRCAFVAHAIGKREWVRRAARSQSSTGARLLPTLLELPIVKRPQKPCQRSIGDELWFLR